MRKLFSMLAVSFVIVVGVSARNIASQTLQSGSSATSQATSSESQTDTTSPSTPRGQDRPTIRFGPPPASVTATATAPARSTSCR